MHLNKLIPFMRKRKHVSTSSIISIHRPVLDRFAQMHRPDVVLSCQISDRPDDLERAVILRSYCRKLRAGYFGRQLTRIIHNDQNGPRRGPSARARINKSYFFKNRSIQSTVRWIRSIWWFGSWKPCGSRG